jgi:hypothetical protein
MASIEDFIADSYDVLSKLGGFSCLSKKSRAEAKEFDLKMGLLST